MKLSDAENAMPSGTAILMEFRLCEYAVLDSSRAKGVSHEPLQGTYDLDRGKLEVYAALHTEVHNLLT